MSKSPVPSKPGLDPRQRISLGLPLTLALIFNLIFAWIAYSQHLGAAYAMVFLGPLVCGAFLIGALAYAAATRTWGICLAGWAIGLLITGVIWL